MKKLDIEIDNKHQQIAWKIRKIGFTVIFFLVVFSVFGVFGNGFLSSSEIKIKNNILKYERFIRAGGPAELIFSFKENKDSLMSVFVSNSYLNNIQIERITPVPYEEIGGDSFTEFIFKINSEDKKGTIKINYNAKEPGLYEAFILHEEETMNFKQIIYP